MIRVGLGCSISLTLIGCANSGIVAPAKTIGTVAARVQLPPLPADCETKEPHAPLTVGAEARSVLKRERQATDRANARVVRCAQNYKNVADAVK